MYKEFDLFIHSTNNISHIKIVIIHSLYQYMNATLCMCLINIQIYSNNKILNCLERLQSHLIETGKLIFLIHRLHKLGLWEQITRQNVILRQWRHYQHHIRFINAYLLDKRFCGLILTESMCGTHADVSPVLGSGEATSPRKVSECELVHLNNRNNWWKKYMPYHSTVYFKH